MRILYHHRTASKDGQSTHIEEMIRGLKSNGCEIVEASPAVGNENPSGGSSGWVGKLKAYLPGSIYELAELAYSVVAYQRIVRKINEFRPDGIYERYNLYLLAGIWAKRKFNLPLILEVNAPMAQERRLYGGLKWPRIADWAERYVWRNADLVLPVTQVLANYIVSQGVAAEKICVIPNGINRDHYQHLPTAQEAKAKLGLESKLVIGFTGFVREWDRLDRIVRWIALQSEELNVHLLVIGDGPARSEIEQCAAQLRVANKVSFTGVVPREEVPALAMAFDIALQTALVPYASPLCLFEYMALSKAIVAPNQPNHHEILTDHLDAVLYDPESDGGIENALSLLCENPQLREAVARGAGSLIERKKLTWNHHSATVVGLFVRLVSVPAANLAQTSLRK